jgi:dipeptidyl aminopeptidase/acylaminoacyl peptidase
MQKILFVFLFSILMALSSHEQPAAKRLMRPSDIYRLPTVSDPQISPDGNWVSYTLTVADSAKDQRNSDIWMISWDGTQDIQLTSSPESESKARWSPDGKFISFLSSRQGSKGSQVWLMDRRGGEGKRLTEIKSGITDYAWKPDGKKLLLTITDPEPEDTSKTKISKPYVIDRYQYKEDIEGYRYKKLYTHLYLFDIDTKKIDTLTRSHYNEGSASWSPDGSRIVFVSNRTEDPDKNQNSDIYVMDAKPGAPMSQLTSWTGADNAPQWSPDGKWIAYTRSSSNADYFMYDQPVICIVAAQGGEPRLISKGLDRPALNPRWTKDGNSILALVEDDRQQYVASFLTVNGQMTRVADGERSFNALETLGPDRLLVSMSEPQLPGEIYALEDGKTRRLTKQMDEFVKPLSLATEEGFVSKSSDGTSVSGILFRPASAKSDQKMPLVLFIHGGPVSQDGFGFDFTRQLLAAGGYDVAAVNYRGSDGRGLDYCKVISGDWGNKEVIDLHGAVDYLVKQGIADPERLGVGGWSYGGILTDYLIASDNRFKAACSGAGTGLTLSLYGVDQYINQYNEEIGPPWKSIDRYLKISYPLLKADRIKTPTLFMSGEKDFNVPTAGSEQMYQALRTLGIPTQLIIYPGQFHGITVPSYQKDRLERYLEWYGKYLGR